MESEVQEAIASLRNQDLNAVAATSAEKFEAIVKIRAALYDMASSYLRDIKKVAVDISKAGGCADQPDVILKFIHHLITTTNGGVFVDGVHGLTDGSVGRHFQLSYDFSTWVVSVVVKSRGHPGCSRLHARCAEVLLSLFVLARTRNPPMFTLLLAEVTRAMIEAIHSLGLISSGAQTFEFG
ncbi:PREDICTED: serine/threonine-protein kinase ATR-like [Priapulus caudatus]|uniref:Serine/threonine-protein kinase ATR-like n=1 Tax=Priapulus caudatus TaxID=37621 RepID=A0ABM1EMI2_PRICU|nr:PREDICTED: serine/threonine-protein kinase ATR-like [Priapulus caudatus]